MTSNYLSPYGIGFFLGEPAISFSGTVGSGDKKEGG